jgi:hypothetical protein
VTNSASVEEVCTKAWDSHPTQLLGVQLARLQGGVEMENEPPGERLVDLEFSFSLEMKCSKFVLKNTLG